MKTVLLSVLLGMFTMLKAQAVISKELFDIGKFSGFWFEVGMSTNSDLFLKQKGIKRLGAIIVTPVENNIRVKAIFDKSQGCVKEDILGNQVDMPGKFAFSRSREAYVVETDYKTYAIVNVSILKNEMTLNALKFFSRTLENTDKGLKRLREISEQIGISRDNVFMLIYDATCVKMFEKVNSFVSLLFIAIDSRERDITSVAQDAGTIVIQHNCLAFDDNL